MGKIQKRVSTGIRSADVLQWIVKHRSTREFAGSDVAMGMGYKYPSREYVSVLNHVGQLVRRGILQNTTPGKTTHRRFRLVVKNITRGKILTTAEPSPRSIPSKLDEIESRLNNVQQTVNKVQAMVDRMLREWGVVL